MDTNARERIKLNIQNTKSLKNSINKNARRQSIKIISSKTKTSINKI